MRKYHSLGICLSVAIVGLLLCVSSTSALAETLKVYLLTGQSNMVGHGYTHYEGDTWIVNGEPETIPTLEFLLDTPDYVDLLPSSTYTFKDNLNAKWMDPRDDVWGVHYKSVDRTLQQVEPTPSTDQSTWSTSIMPMGPGFGGNNSKSGFGPELGMGTRLGDALDSPVFLFKSCTGGTTLAEDWRPPSAVTSRGGTQGIHYTNTVDQFKSFLDDLDADLADDGMLNAYNSATDYEVAGFVWFQGWNEKFNDGAGEYADNIVDLVHDIRASDARIPNDLGVIIPESSDQDAPLNAGRVSAVATLNTEIPGSAVYFENNDMIGNDLGYGFSSGWGYHFNAKAENYLEIGWRTGQAILDAGFIGTPSGPLPDPSVTVVDATFDGIANDTNDAFRLITNGIGPNASFDTATGLIDLGTSDASGTGNTGIVSVSTMDFTSLGTDLVTLSVVVDSQTEPQQYNGTFLGFQQADGTGGGPELWNNAGPSFGVVIDGSNGPGVGTVTLGGYLGGQYWDDDTFGVATDASIQDGFTAELSFDANGWTVTMTGLEDSSGNDLPGGSGTWADVEGFDITDFTSAMRAAVEFQSGNESLAMLDLASINASISATQLNFIPEPSTLVSSCIGCLGLMLFLRRRRRSGSPFLPSCHTNPNIASDDLDF